MSRFLLGVDAGATKTDFVLYDRQNQRLYAHRGGPGNHEVLPKGFGSLKEMLARHLEILVHKASISIEEIDMAALGISGDDTRRQHGIICQILTELGLRRFEMGNDARLGIWAACPDGIGVCAVNGTGFCVMASDGEGEYVQIGGLGFLSGDKGGGDYLSQRVIEAVYRQLWKNGSETMMTPRLLETLSCAGRDDFAELLMEKAALDPAGLRLAASKLLQEAGSLGDPVAREILTECAEEYAISIQGAVHALPKLETRLKGRPLSIVLVGSVFTRGADRGLLQTLQARLNSLLPQMELRLVALQDPPVIGSLCWACRADGREASDEERSFWRHQLSEQLK